jgi:hypothetical protein
MRIVSMYNIYSSFCRMINPIRNTIYETSSSSSSQNNIYVKYPEKRKNPYTKLVYARNEAGENILLEFDWNDTVLFPYKCRK